MIWPHVESTFFSMQKELMDGRTFINLLYLDFTEYKYIFDYIFQNKIDYIFHPKYRMLVAGSITQK